MSGRIAKSQIPTRPQASLTQEAKNALIQAKNQIKAGHLPPVFGNAQGRTAAEGPPRPAADQGCNYHEVRVGQARPTDPQGLGGVKRLVLEIEAKSRIIREIYYTEEHYGKGSFVRLI
ncbi:MAG TPA: hypothetical protein PKD86_14460 [Gemmatales bacterium]|nr:hypothetical protein [Gemmatales bacterium]